MTVERQYNVKTMAEIFQTTVAAFRQRRYDNPTSVPPAYRLGKRLMWNPKVVEEFILRAQRREAQKEETAAAATAPGVRPGPRKRRSRKMRQAEAA